MIIDNETFASILNDDQYLYMEKEIGKDNRRHKLRGNLEDRFANVKQWNESKMKKDVDRIVDMLPPTGQDIKVGTLKEVLKKSYGYDENYSLKAIRETAENDVRVRARRNSYSRKINNDDIELRKV